MKPRIDFDRIFAEWRGQRRLDYEKLAVLVSEGMKLAVPGSRLAKIFNDILAILHSMANYDCIRFMANGVTRVELDKKYAGQRRPIRKRSSRRINHV